MSETTTTFEAGCTYAEHWITDYTLRPLVTVTSRTARFVTLRHSDGTTKRCGVQVIDGEEIAYPHGRYSMCPILRASAKEPPMHCTEYVAGDPDGCARCGERADLHGGEHVSEAHRIRQGADAALGARYAAVHGHLGTDEQVFNYALELAAEGDADALLLTEPWIDMEGLQLMQANPKPTLDDQVMAMADQIERAGKVDEADELRTCMAFLRERFVGNDTDGDLAKDLLVVRDYAEEAMNIVLRHRGRI